MGSFLRDFLSGGVAGAIAKTATAPIERVKLLIQTQDSNPAVTSGKVQRYTSMTDCAVRVYKEQGALAFWRGNLVNVLRYFPTQAFNFAFKDSIKAVFPKYDKNEAFMSYLAVNVASGGFAGASSLLLVYPLDYARTRLAADMGSGERRFNGIVHCLVDTARGPSGPLGLYNGFGASVVGIIPYRGVYFGLFDSVKTLNPFENDHGALGIASKFCIAQSVAVVAAYASYPFDTVRRRLQMQSDRPRDEWKYSGIIDCFQKVARDEGIAGMFKGAGANVIRLVGSALVLVLYDEIKHVLNTS